MSFKAFSNRKLIREVAEAQLFSGLYAVLSYVAANASLIFTNLVALNLTLCEEVLIYDVSASM